MSGGRQHFVPRFLLKGFASRNEGKNSYTWVFRYGKSPFETNIINVGVSREFYSFDGSTELDDLITNMEDEFAIYVDELRSYVTETELENPKIPQLITHLVLRTKYLREGFRRSTEYLLNALLQALERPEYLGKLILNNIQNHPEEFWKKMRPSFKGYHLSRRQKVQLLNSIAKLAPALIQEQYPQIMLLIDMVKHYIRENVVRLAKESHIKALAKAPLPKARVEFAQGLKRCLVIDKPGSFILGDVAVVSKVEPDGKLKPLIDVSDNVIQTWLPISDRHLLIGRIGTKPLDRDAERINRDTAFLSQDFILSSKNSEREKAYALVLGTRSGLLTDEEMQKVVADVLAS